MLYFEVVHKYRVTEWWGAGEKWNTGNEKFAESEADAGAKMLIYLIEKRFIAT